MIRTQIIYPRNDRGEIRENWLNESKVMKEKGFIIKNDIYHTIDRTLYRGNKIWEPSQCIEESSIIQGWEEIKRTSFMFLYYDVIKSHSIPTCFLNDLTSFNVEQISKEYNWDRVFIKSPSRSLFFLGDFASVWPNTSIEEMIIEYERLGLTGPFAIRKFIDDPEIFYNEQRYWILNGNAYHPSGEIPDFVKEYGKKMYEFSGSHYFTMDVAGEYIVEINPGESSDRGGDNPLDWFCEIFAKEFLNK